MSEIQFDCPKCGHNLIVDAEGAGMSVPCPGCSGQIIIPTSPSESSGPKDLSKGRQRLSGHNHEPLQRMIIAIIGCALLCIGTFLPFIKCNNPSLGTEANMSIAEMSVVLSLIPLALSLLSFLVAYRRRFGWLWLTGILSLLFTIGMMVIFTSDKIVPETRIWWGKAQGAFSYGGYVMLMGGVVVLLSASRVLTKPRRED